MRTANESNSRKLIAILVVLLWLLAMQRGHAQTATRSAIAGVGVQRSGISKGVDSAIAGEAQTPAPPASRAQATAIIADARKIVTPHGVERLEKVRIGGIEQWVSIRGDDRRNPVLIVLHGGPGYVDMPMSWWFGRGWEEYFTVVYWDQRAAGKTYLLNDPAAVMPTLTPERMVADAEGLITWVRKDLGKQKVFLLGHSFGSYLGVEIAQHHPEWL